MERKLQYFKYSQRQPYTQLIIHKLTLGIKINAVHSLNIGFDPVFVVSAYFRSCTFYLLSKRISLQIHNTFSEWQPAWSWFFLLIVIIMLSQNGNFLLLKSCKITFFLKFTSGFTLHYIDQQITLTTAVPGARPGIPDEIRRKVQSFRGGAVEWASWGTWGVWTVIWASSVRWLRPGGRRSVVFAYWTTVASGFWWTGTLIWTEVNIAV